MKKYWISLFVLILISGYAIYATLFFAWLTATPLSSKQLSRAQYDCYFWAVIFVISVLSDIWIARMIWLHCKLRDKQSS
jgi:hypothetical protein